MAVKGVFTSDAGIVGDRKGDFASALIQIAPTGRAPMFALTSGMQQEDARDTIITWFEENHLSGRINTAVDYNTAATTIVVNDASFVTPNTIFMVESTGEYIYVTAVAGNSLTVVRGFGGTTPAAIDGNPTPAWLQRITNAFEEGSSRPESVANLGYPRMNYTQIFRTAWDVTGTAKKISWHTGDVVRKNKADAAMFHAEDIERALLWGRKAVGIKNSKPWRTMDGFLAQITTNVQTQSGLGGNIGYTDLRNFIQSIFERNIKGKPNERIAYCGNSALAVVDDIIMNLPSSQMQLQVGQTDYGMRVTRWITPFGDISLITHPIMVESPMWTNELYVLHPGACKIRYLRRTSPDDYDSNGTRAGVDADFGTLTTEMSCQYMAEITGGKLTGITTADIS